MRPRPFRTRDSYEAEAVTRDMVAGYLRDLGFQNVSDERRRFGLNQSQMLIATSASGAQLRMQVKLCWRRSGASLVEQTYSAAQLLARITDDDWAGSLAARIERDRSQGITHYLFIQREGERIIHAALVPLLAVLPIWLAQRAISSRLIEHGELGDRHSNPAMNGSSPTLYLQDDRAPQVAEALWSYPGVRNLASHAAIESVYRREQTGAGFGNAEDNKLVEDAAIGIVRQHYENDGWRVHSVEHERRGFDLKCQKGNLVEDVEVKGARGGEQNFIITTGEVEQARVDKNFILMVVTLALSEAPLIARYSGAKFLDLFEISPIQYRAMLRHQEDTEDERDSGQAL